MIVVLLAGRQSRNRQRSTANPKRTNFQLDALAGCAHITRMEEMEEKQWIEIAKILGFENYPEGSDSWIFQGRHYFTKDVPDKVTEFLSFEVRERNSNGQ